MLATIVRKLRWPPCLPCYGGEQRQPSNGATSVDPASELRRADALHIERRYNEAIEAYRSAVAGDASLHAAWYGLGCAQLAAEGIRRCRRGAASRCRAAAGCGPGARCNLAEALFQLGDVDGRDRRIPARRGQWQCGGARLLRWPGIACIAPGGSQRTISTSWRRGGAGSTPQARGIQRVTPAPREDGRKLRVGYLSAFFGARNLDEGATWARSTPTTATVSSCTCSPMGECRRRKPATSIMRRTASGRSAACPPRPPRIHRPGGPGRAGGPERLQLPAPAAAVSVSPGAAAGLLDRHVRHHRYA